MKKILVVSNNLGIDFDSFVQDYQLKKQQISTDADLGVLSSDEIIDSIEISHHPELFHALRTIFPETFDAFHTKFSMLNRNNLSTISKKIIKANAKNIDDYGFAIFVQEVCELEDLYDNYHLSFVVRFVSLHNEARSVENQIQSQTIQVVFKSYLFEQIKNYIRDCTDNSPWLFTYLKDEEENNIKDIYARMTNDGVTQKSILTLALNQAFSIMLV